MTDHEQVALLRDLATRFASESIAPRWSGLENGALSSVLEHASELGLMSLAEHALDIDALCRVLSPIARADASVAVALLVQAGGHALWPDPIDPSTRLTWPANTDLRARPDVRVIDGRLHGTLRVVPLVERAEFVVTPVRDGERVSLALVETKSLSPVAVRVLGLRGCAPADVHLEGLACSHLVPIDDGALRAFVARMSLAVTAIGLGILQGCLATARDYASQRVQGGRTILQWSEVRRMLGEIEEDSATIECALDGVLGSITRDDRAWQSRALYLGCRAAELACRSTTDGVQILGGYGYMADYPQERRMRDARQLRALLGASPERRARTFDELVL
jgi:alkylation response protein AidB-like acyl-CoA dehydrogenase